MINYQGKITTPTGALVDTTVKMTFTIYDDSTSGNILWADTLGSVAVEKGIFSVLLGSGNPIPDSVFPGDVRYLGVTVGTDAEMSPRKEIVSVAYAYKSEFSDTAKFAQVAVTDGDWTPDTAGINIYRLTGNVGIGTPMPGYELDVSGDIRATGTLYGTVDNADKVDGYHAGNSSGQVAVSNGTKCTDLNADKTDGNHVATVEVSTLGTNYIVNTSWAQIYTYSTTDAVRIKNATSSGRYIRYWYSKNLGTPSEGFLYSGESVDVTGLSGGIDIRIASTTIQGDGRHITLLGIIANHIIWGHVIYAD
jgi:hypothetical protein